MTRPTVTGNSPEKDSRLQNSCQKTLDYTYIKMDDVGVPLFWETSIHTHTHTYIYIYTHIYIYASPNRRKRLNPQKIPFHLGLTKNIQKKRMDRPRGPFFPEAGEAVNGDFFSEKNPRNMDDD